MSTTKNDGGPQMTPPTIKELCEKATPGPWRWTGYSWVLAEPGHTPVANFSFAGDGKGDANAQLIARCSPSTMLAVVEALENAISIMRADAKQFREQSDGRMAMASDAAAERWETALNLLNGKAP